MDDFIEVYPNALDPAACQQIVARFEASGQAARGRTGGGVDTALKDSFDIPVSARPEWQDVAAALNRAASLALREYVRKYPFLLIGPLGLRVPGPDGRPLLVTADTFPTLAADQYHALLQRAFRPGTINLQKYLAGSGGYPHWHSEMYPDVGRAEALHRVLLWTVYLNDVPQAGETEFYYQKRAIKPQAGALLVAPAGFTHTHRGNTPVGGDKYIATSWVLFQRAEVLYGGPPRPPGS
jgi:hypothetical protein